MVKIGSDFELPLMNGGQVRSIEGLLGGTKQEPIDIGNNCQKQEDNVMAEFNIPAVTTFKDFKKYIDYCINYGNKFLYQAGALIMQSSGFYSANEVSTDQGATFGCEPSFDVYTQDFTTIENPSTKLRSAGFHLHIDCTDDEDVIQRLVKKLDLYLGVPSILLDPDTDRRALYGKAGEFRFTEYGIEYRVLGSGMMRHLEFVWNGIFKALEDTSEHDAEVVRNIINTGDVMAAKAMYPELNVEVYA